MYLRGCDLIFVMFLHMGNKDKIYFCISNILATTIQSI